MTAKKKLVRRKKPRDVRMEPMIIGFNSVERYEDGCEKTTWFNFHENGHQHVCVCGEYFGVGKDWKHVRVHDADACEKK